MAPVKEWWTYGGGGQRLRHAGTFRTALDRPPQPIRGEQYFSSDLPGFVWWGRITMAPGLWVEARDACIGAEGNMLIRLESTYTLDDARGPDMDEGSLLRLLVEMAWFPTSLLDQRYVTWSPIEDRSARATLRLRGREVSASFFFGDDGLPARMTAERPRSKGTRAPWVGEYSDYREVEGLRVPFVASVSWVLDGVRTEVRALGHGIVRIRPRRAVLTFPAARGPCRFPNIVGDGWRGTPSTG
jgi:uncharacterized protein DUF6544